MVVDGYAAIYQLISRYKRKIKINGKQRSRWLRRFPEAGYPLLYSADIGMAGRGEAVANINNYYEIDPSGVVDKYGIPVLRFM